ncbi:MAG: endolytic transglycosylase MltG [Lachnospiraceae bacterium]|nr:endolytic transglycosylase MltG [Lachnospiraceae bacterium]
MSDTANDINRVTTAIIKVSIRLIIYALVILILYEGITAGYQFGYEVFNPTPMTRGAGYEKTVMVQEDQSGLQVGQMLKEAGLIRNAYAFAVQARLYGYEICPGTYVLDTTMDPRDILDVLDEGAADQKGEKE